MDKIETIMKFIDEHQGQFCQLIMDSKYVANNEYFASEDFTLDTYLIENEHITINFSVKKIPATYRMSFNLVAESIVEDKTLTMYLVNNQKTVLKIVEPRYQYVHVYNNDESSTIPYSHLVEFALALVPDLAQEFSTIVRLFHTYEDYENNISATPYFTEMIRNGSLKGTYDHVTDQIILYLFNYNMTDVEYNIIHNTLHELRHVYQHKYNPEEMKYHRETESNMLTGQEYLDTWPERDANDFAAMIMDVNYDLIFHVIAEFRQHYGIK
ncbi:hypothetical protein ABGV42_00850 [Paenibacillus pabuli]|uniref:hypothetical protein n=1 Tax=Paenibacillus pabuli TaxID=1472 RepID=UPI003242F433